jgi:GTP cyclohydrolase I
MGESMNLVNAELIPVQLYGVAHSAYIKYNPGDPACVHGRPVTAGAECLNCRIFQQDISAPDYTVSATHPEYDSPEDKLTHTAHYLLTQCAGLNSENPQEAETAARFVRALKEMTTREEFKFTTFESVGNEMISETSIPFTSLCRHHILPFSGFAHVAYVPNERMAGLSKLARAVQYWAHALQTQEELTNEILAFIVEQLDPLGAAVVMEAEHLCMTVRGVKAPGVLTRTAAMHGVFSEHTKTAKAEFLSSIDNRR